jgi:hypothetical protein
MSSKWMRFAATGAIALAGAFAAFGTGSDASAVTRAFRGHAEGGVTGGEFPTLTASAEGEGTHLGAFTRTETVTFGAGGTVSGTVDFVGHNEENKIFVSFEGQFTSETTIEGTYEITGGEGRFDGATGTATFVADITDFPEFTVTFEGTIDY